MTKVKTPKIPQMRVHKATGQAYVRLNGKRKYLGKYNLPETNQQYERTIGVNGWLDLPLLFIGYDLLP